MNAYVRVIRTDLPPIYLGDFKSPTHTTPNEPRGAGQYLTPFLNNGALRNFTAGTAAVVTGTTAETYDLDGLTLTLRIDSQNTGNRTFSVTFGDDGMALADVVTAVNSAISAVTASTSSGHLRLTTKEVGVTLTVLASAASSVLGMSGLSNSGSDPQYAHRFTVTGEFLKSYTSGSLSKMLSSSYSYKGTTGAAIEILEANGDKFSTI